MDKLNKRIREFAEENGLYIMRKGRRTKKKVY